MPVFKEFIDERNFPDADVGPFERAPFFLLAACCLAVAIDSSFLSPMSIKVVDETGATGSIEPSFLTLMIERFRSPVLKRSRKFPFFSRTRARADWLLVTKGKFPRCCGLEGPRLSEPVPD